MSARRRVRQFAAPLVIVAASPACKKPEDTWRPHAGVADQLLFYDGASGSCMTYPDRHTVKCGDSPTVIFAWKTIGGTTFDTGSMTCQPTACPPDLLPTLTDGVHITRREGDACYWNDLQVLCPGHVIFDDPSCYDVDATGQREDVDCPASLLPPTPTGTLIYAQGAYCFPIHASGGQGRVICPPGGATVVFPTEATRDLGGGSHLSFNQWAMQCQEWTDMSCPQGASCNPPPPQPVECPADLLPHLAGGEKPTEEKDGKCYWHEVQVACP